MPVYKRPDRKRPYYYKFDLDRQTYKAGGFLTRRQAEDAEAAARLRVQRSRTPTAFSTAVTMRLDYVQAYCRPSHYQANVAYLRRFAEWRDLDLSEITSEMIRRRLVELSKTMSPANANKHLIALRSVFEQAVNDGHLGRNPCRGLKKLPVARAVKYVPPTADIEAVLALASPLDRAYLTVIWQLAARVREVNNLTWEDVDFNRRLVRLWTRKKRGGHKTPRLVEMNQRAFDALKLAQWRHFSRSGDDLGKIGHYVRPRVRFPLGLPGKTAWILGLLERTTDKSLSVRTCHPRAGRLRNDLVLSRVRNNFNWRSFDLFYSPSLKPSQAQGPAGHYLTSIFPTMPGGGKSTSSPETARRICINKS